MEALRIYIRRVLEETATSIANGSLRGALDSSDAIAKGKRTHHPYHWAAKAFADADGYWEPIDRGFEARRESGTRDVDRTYGDYYVPAFDDDIVGEWDKHENPDDWAIVPAPPRAPDDGPADTGFRNPGEF